MMDSKEYKLLVSEGRQWQCEQRKGELLGKLLPQPLFFLLFFFPITLVGYHPDSGSSYTKTTRMSTCNSLLVVPFHFCSVLQWYQTVLPKADVSRGYLMPNRHTWPCFVPAAPDLPTLVPCRPQRQNCLFSSIQLKSQQRTARVALEATILFIPSAQSRT